MKVTHLRRLLQEQLTKGTAGADKLRLADEALTASREAEAERDFEKATAVLWVLTPIPPAAANLPAPLRCVLPLISCVAVSGQRRWQH